MTPVDDLLHEAAAMRILGGEIIDATDIGTHATEFAVKNWRVFPLNGKMPAIPNPHPKGSRERQTCKGECGQLGHGVLDATTDVDTVARWWGGRYRGANIGGRVPDSMITIDVDPRHGGDESLAEHEQRHFALPETLTTISGRGDGGRHLFFRRPAGKLSDRRLGAGLDLKTSAGYVVLAPSIHPDSGQPYTRIDAPVAAPPNWLVDLLLVRPAHTITRTARRSSLSGRLSGSIADQFSARTTWSEILGPHGWRCLDPDPDADGARWLHPAATSACSATVRHGALFVYSTSTVFDVTESGNPQGYTRFRAYAVLNHGADLRAAAQAITKRAA